MVGAHTDLPVKLCGGGGGCGAEAGGGWLEAAAQHQPEQRLAPEPAGDVLGGQSQSRVGGVGGVREAPATQTYIEQGIKFTST